MLHIKWYSANATLSDEIFGRNLSIDNFDASIIINNELKLIRVEGVADKFIERNKLNHVKFTIFDTNCIIEKNHYDLFVGSKKIGEIYNIGVQ